MKVGSVLKMIRLRLNMTQQQVSHKAQINQEYLSMIECNKKVPSFSILVKLCDVYCIPVFAIFVLGAEDKDISNKHLKEWVKNKKSIYDCILKTFVFNADL